MTALTWIVLLALASTSVDGPTIHKGDIVANLRLDIPDEGPATGLARLHLSIQVTGPETLTVESPRFEDALSAWRVAQRFSSWREVDGRVQVELSITLEQTKFGQVTPPGVVVRVRSSEGSEEFTWHDPLHEARDVRPPDFQEDIPPSPWPARVGLTALLLMTTLAITLAFRRFLRRPRPEVPLHLRALALLENAKRSPSEELAHFDLVVRDYLDERFQLTTRRQTTSEMRSACAFLPEEARSALEELAQLAERVKFAGLAPDEGARLRALGLSRQVIEVCATLPIGKGEESTENGKNG